MNVRHGPPKDSNTPKKGHAEVEPSAVFLPSQVPCLSYHAVSTPAHLSLGLQLLSHPRPLTLSSVHVEQGRKGHSGWLGTCASMGRWGSAWAPRPSSPHRASFKPVSTLAIRGASTPGVSSRNTGGRSHTCAGEGGKGWPAAGVGSRQQQGWVPRSPPEFWTSQLW